MAWFEVDIYRKCVDVDLHDYSHRTAIAVSREKIKEAYEHGFEGGSLLLALRHNPAPVDGDWKEMPVYEYR